MSKSTVAVIDYGMGNLHSAAKALEHVAPGAKVVVTPDAETILSADRVVFPGVGAIRDCVGEILRLGLDDVVREAALNKPLLGICVGMQSMMTHSQENGGVDCLDLYAGEVKFFGDNLKDASGEKLKVPHMGWNQVQQVRPHPLWKAIPDNSRFYFVHSYYVTVQDESLITGRGEYGVPFVATLGCDNVFAAQFHPEKSSRPGLQLLKNFMEWDGTL
ncbi:imidazole glycerol phosphate synthase subunit HisH [Ketobacter sp.]|uniref:imidazole glycerol phosphate synthase subunit HisH n=1 Tax=Ketobacter sp. TaxID=2083498 RepID=UPI000F11315D|nr:imidazole glycerol phosphate synthase subunit HisH [Ketobacter sp.]RLU01899.1 MAG: imidazole glycerol phosphate synthase subunit HisH [Ketobacter sp.]